MEGWQMSLECSHRLKNQGAEKASYRGPEFYLRAQPLMQATKEATTPLSDLIYSKRQEHQQRQNRRQMPSAVPVIMFKMVALIFKRVESFVLDLPPRSTTAHHGFD